MFKNMFLIVTSTIFFSIFFLSSCDDKPVNSFDSEERHLPRTAGGGNTTLVNPYEYVGIEHNKYLDVFMVKLESSINNGSFNNIPYKSNAHRAAMADVCIASFDLVYPQHNLTKQELEDLYDDLDINSWDNTNGDLHIMKNKAFDALDLDATTDEKLFTKNLINDMIFVIENSDPEDIFIDMNNVINQHEQRILTHSWNTNEDYALGTISVAKHSLQFWENYYMNLPYTLSLKSNNSKQHLSEEEQAAQRKERKVKGSIVLTADVVGYVAGGVSGAVASSALGPAGTVGGVLGGKAIGSFVASSTVGGAIAVYDALKDFFTL